MSKRGRKFKITLNKHGLTKEDEKFCRLFASDKEFFGNGVQSFIEAYDPPKTLNWYNRAKTAATVLLSKPIFCKRISQLLELDGFNDNAVDKQLAFVIAQQRDLPSKVRGIQEYNKLKGRVEQKLKLSADKSLSKLLDAADRHSRGK